MLSNTNGVGGGSTTPPTKPAATSAVGVNLGQLLNFAEGKVDRAELKTDEERKLYDKVAPSYDANHMREVIEEQVLYRNLRPHMVDPRLKIPDPIPVITRKGAVIASEGNISAVVGAAKSKKTFLCTAMVGALLRQDGESSFGIEPKNSVVVLWVDTEQSANHVQRVVKRIHRLAGWSEELVFDKLKTLTLREIEPRQRLEMMEDAIKLFKPKLVVVDGISDLMYNSNCIEESDSIVGRMMALSTEYNCHIMSVLHTNPNSDKARGHIGSTLQRKVETMLFVHKMGGCSVVEPQFCRNEEFEPFAFAISEEALPKECEMPRNESCSDECVAIMKEHFPNGVSRAVLINKIIEQLNIGESAAKTRVCRAIQKGVLALSNGLVML